MAPQPLTTLSQLPVSSAIVLLDRDLDLQRLQVSSWVMTLQPAQPAHDHAPHAAPPCWAPARPTPSPGSPAHPDGAEGTALATALEVGIVGTSSCRSSWSMRGRDEERRREAGRHRSQMAPELVLGPQTVFSKEREATRVFK